MKEKEVKTLIQKYHAGNCTDEEIVFLENWYAQWNQEIPLGLSPEELESELSAISEGIPALHRTKEKQLWPRIVAAASILLFLSIGGYFLLHKQPQQQIAQNQVHDIAPGGNKTILTLANGKKIILNNAHNGLLAEQGGSAVNKTADGAIVYNDADSGGAQNPELLTYNAITIPRGGEYQLLILPDGSKVWVNSASSLRYPTAFTGNERKVELTGEAYFEVAHNAAKPFRVVSKSQTVEVLGTHFNINSYDDEPAIKTTLLEGKVKVTATSNNAVKFLQPGEQAALNTSSFIINPVDTEEAVAWKNGQFMFNNDNITYIMRTISRWYNVEIDYSGPVPGNGFYGGVSRFKNVSEVLNTLQLTGKVHFKIEGRKITVSK
ncbi:MAG TPA: FecR domain-containing protein [Mucilaginibacter sp.]|jgi:transmembrane sensor|nr:FecR domain-containing protein [Mucilaginibacter sp.]